MKGGLRSPNPDSRRPKEGPKSASPLHSWGSPNKEEQNQIWLPHHYILRGPKEGGNGRRGLRVPNLNSRGHATKRGL